MAKVKIAIAGALLAGTAGVYGIYQLVSNDEESKLANIAAKGNSNDEGAAPGKVSNDETVADTVKKQSEDAKVSAEDWPHYISRSSTGDSRTWEFGVREPVYFDAKENVQGTGMVSGRYVLVPNTLDEAKAIERAWGQMRFDLDQKLQESEYRHATPADRRTLMMTMDTSWPQGVITGSVIDVYRVGPDGKIGDKVDDVANLDIVIPNELEKVRRYEIGPRLKQADGWVDNNPRRIWYGDRDPAQGRHARNQGYRVNRHVPQRRTQHR